MPDPAPSSDAAIRPAPHVMLRALREARGLTQQGWATWLGYSVATVRRWESGTAAPTAEAEEALLAQCQEKGLFRTFDLEPLHGFTLTPELLRDLLAEARLKTNRQPAASTASTAAPEPPVTPERPAALGPVGEPTPPPPVLPSGTVTFLFTDLEGHTPLWESHPEAMRAALARHDAILRQAVLAHNGHIVKTTGDGLHAAFGRPTDALGAALDAQRALAAETWELPRPLRARVGLHTGTAEERDGDYFGPEVNRAARVMQAGHGGQVLLSRVTARLVRSELSGATLRDLGVHRLKDLQEPERLFQVIAPNLRDHFPPVLSLSAPTPNLPIETTPLIGREQEVAAIRQRLLDPRVRIVTVTGTGGTGKSRVALQVAAKLQAHFRDGVFFVPLATIDDPAMVILEIGRSLGVREQASAGVLSTLTEFLHAKELLLVLDNFEQVLSAAEGVSELLRACATLKVLVTSRVRLRLYGEQEIPLAPLRTPAFPWPLLDELTEFESVQLFIERARGVAPDFHVNRETALAVAEICARLDGLPLAIELAASRVKLLPPMAMCARLEQRLMLLVGGPRDRHPRQQTLRNTIDWSYQLLSSADQALFRQMGVFAGSWSLAAAQAVYQSPAGWEAADAEVLDRLDALIDASLVRQDASGGEPRFSMLETIREYALERLATSGEAEATRVRHAAYFVGLGEQAGPHLGPGAEHSTWLQRLGLERDNLRAALRWCIDTEEVDPGLRLGASVSRYWYGEGGPGEGQEWLNAILRLVSGAGPSAVRCAALVGAALLALARGDLATAQPLLEESLAIARQLADPSQIASCLHYLGALAARRGDLAEARRLLEEAAAIYQRDEPPSGAVTYRVLGRLLAEHGDFAGARTWLERSQAAYQQLNDKTGIASGLGIMGFVAAVDGDLARAEVMCEQALREARESGNLHVIAWNCLDLAFVRLAQRNYSDVTRLCIDSLDVRSNSLKSRERVAAGLQLLAAVAVHNGHPNRALRLFGAASAHYEASVPMWRLWDRAMRERQQSAAASVPGTAADAAFEAGRAMTTEEAIAFGLEAASESAGAGNARAPA